MTSTTNRSHPAAEEMRLIADDATVRTSALLLRPPQAHCLLVMAHGAGAGMRHPSMEALSRRLAEESIATLRYQFPYMEGGSGPPDAQATLITTVRAAVATAHEVASDLALFAGGRSMGGRMTSLAASKEPLRGIQGLIFFSFPLHPSGSPGTGRADHLAKVEVPMLFLQGSRDRLAELDLLRPVVERLGTGATLQVLDGADHSFRVLKSCSISQDDVPIWLASRAKEWTEVVVG